jgi:3-deoxy-D-manno-octulosonate 8-phosphate phosphatase (KDO 8-P phosphatase)
MDQNLLDRASRIQLLLMDVDGVLTDGKLYNVPLGTDGVWESKGFDSRDGIGLRWLSWYGIETGVISGRLSPATVERARQLSMKYVYQGHIEKIPILEEIIADAQIAPDRVAYIGDDLTDAVIMRRVGLGVAVANARPEVKRIAHFTTDSVGGDGAVREVCELLLQSRGVWEELLRKYEVL